MNRAPELIRTLRTTPPLPAVAFRILELVREPDYSLDEFVALVRQDPSLTARVLRLANSASFALASPATTVADAVSCIGTRNLVNLVLVSCAANQFQGASTSIYGNADALWRHSFALATAARWLAERAGFDEVETAFTAAILHNVGRVALSQVSTPMADGPIESTEPCEIEANLFGIDHAAAAQIVTSTWGLPRRLVRALATHHDEREIAGDPLAALVRLAEDTVAQCGLGLDLSVDTQPVAPSTDAIACLALTAADCDAAGAAVQLSLEENAELLNLHGVSDR